MRNAKRRPWVAGVFSLLCPGLGQLYSGYLWLAVVWLGISFILGYALVNVMVRWDSAPANVLLPAILGVVYWLLAAAHAWSLAGRRSKDFALCSYNRWYCYGLFVMIAMVTSLVLDLVLNQYDSYRIPTASMEDTLFMEDVVLADHSAYDLEGPKTGDIVIFIFPGDRITKYVKRCVAQSGDTVLVRNKELYVNGVAAGEPGTIKFVDTLTNGEQKVIARGETGRNSRDNFGPYVVPVDHYFMLGDNRDHSYDSRYFRSVPRELVLCKVMRIVWSSRWNRIGLEII